MPRCRTCTNERKAIMPVKAGSFSKVPNRFFGSGTASSIGKSASLVYIALWEHANRHGENVFKASDKALASETGLGTRTLCNARKRLLEKGLICCSRQDGQSYVYTLPAPSLEW